MIGRIEGVVPCRRQTLETIQRRQVGDEHLPVLILDCLGQRRHGILGQQDDFAAGVRPVHARQPGPAAGVMHIIFTARPPAATLALCLWWLRLPCPLSGRGPRTLFD